MYQRATTTSRSRAAFFVTPSSGVDISLFFLLWVRVPRHKQAQAHFFFNNSIIDGAVLSVCSAACLRYMIGVGLVRNNHLDMIGHFPVFSAERSLLCTNLRCSEVSRDRCCCCNITTAQWKIEWMDGFFS